MVTVWAAVLLAEKAPPRGGKASGNQDSIVLHKRPLFIPIKSGERKNKNRAFVLPQTHWPPSHLQCPPCSSTHYSSQNTHHSLPKAHMHVSPHCLLKSVPLFQAINECLVLQPHRPHLHVNTIPDCAQQLKATTPVTFLRPGRMNSLAPGDHPSAALLTVSFGVPT